MSDALPAVLGCDTGGQAVDSAAADDWIGYPAHEACASSLSLADSPEAIPPVQGTRANRSVGQFDHEGGWIEAGRSRAELPLCIQPFDPSAREGQFFRIPIVDEKLLRKRRAIVRCLALCPNQSQPTAEPFATKRFRIAQVPAWPTSSRAFLRFWGLPISQR